MKKLMIALGVVALAAASQAATFQWQVKTSYVYKPGSTTDHDVGGTAYLFLSSYGQETLLKTLRGEGVEAKTLAEIASASAVNKDGSGNFVGGTMSGGQVAKSGNFDADVTSPDYLHTFFVIMDGDNVFISSINDTQASTLATGATIKFASQKDASQAALHTGAWDGAGWYSVPEPTSGLLLLLGVAGLALRRRRA